MIGKINLDRWRFVFQHSSPFDRAQGTAKADEVFEFETAADLLCHLGNEPDDAYRFQRNISCSLKSDNMVADWRKKRTLLKDLKHFPKYRGSSYEDYHNAARDVANCKASDKQRLLFDGLLSEIEASQVIVPIGQRLFHGRADNDLHTLQPYPSFVSTTLDPIVAMNSAFRRAGVGRNSARPVVYILTLDKPLPALWGQIGSSSEWELLLLPELNVEKQANFDTTRFDLLEANVTIAG